MRQKPSQHKLGDFLEGKGFYIVLFLCVAAIGISGYFLFRGLFAQPEGFGSESLSAVSGQAEMTQEDAAGAAAGETDPSPGEEGTAAARMEYPPTEVAQQRAEFLAELESRVIDEYHDSRMGQKELVLCEGYSEEDEAYCGRSYAESPDIDGKIWFTSETPVAPGQFVTVELEDVVDGEPVGTVCEEESL